MKQIIDKIKPHHLVYFLAGGGILLAALNFTGQFNPFAALNFNPSVGEQPFRPIEEFVLFAADKVELNQDVQSLRGNIGSNEEIKIGERTQIVGDLFSNQIRLAEEVIINGNTFSKQLILAPTTQILGTSSTNISFPVAKIPEISVFTFGVQGIKTQPNSEITLSPGSFRDLEIGENSRITFQPGTYNLHTFRARQNSKLIFESGATLNIAESITIDNNVSLFSKNNQIKPENILFQTPTNSIINIGKNSNLTFRLIALNTQVQIGEDSLIRGNIWAKEIIIGERTTISETSHFAIPKKAEDIVQVGNLRFFVNFIHVNFTTDITQEDAERIALLINAKITSFDPTTNSYSFQISTRTPEELQVAIDKIRSLNDPKIEGVTRGYPLKPSPF